MGKDVVVRARVFAMGMAPVQEEITGMHLVDPPLQATPKKPMTCQEIIEDIHQAFRDYHEAQERILKEYHEALQRVRQPKGGGA